jgi:hypothetical protein
VNINPTAPPAPLPLPLSASTMLFLAYKTAYTGPMQVAVRPRIIMTARRDIFDFEFYFPTCIRADYSMDIRLRNIATNTTTVLSTVPLTDRIVYEDMEHQGGRHIIKNYDMRTTQFSPGNYAFSFVLRNQLGAPRAVSLTSNYTIS